MSTRNSITNLYTNTSGIKFLDVHLTTEQPEIIECVINFLTESGNSSLEMIIEHMLARAASICLGKED